LKEKEEKHSFSSLVLFKNHFPLAFREKAWYTGFINHEESDMLTKRIYLREDDEDIYLDVYAVNDERLFGGGAFPLRRALLVIPGGGYHCVCDDREGEAIALAFLSHGFNAFVLHYSVARRRTFPSQLIEASLAMKHIKDCAKEYCINPEEIFVTGFSAGGHLACSLGLLWHLKEIYDEVDMPFGYNKPKGMMLGYPVITGFGSTHTGTHNNLWGTDEPTEEQLHQSSLEEHVDERSAALFVMHTSDDAVVPVRNALLLASAYAEKGLPFELHVYPHAPHGVALGNELTECGNPALRNEAIAKWVEQAAYWAKHL
jgi:acetyl esterase/lipase